MDFLKNPMVLIVGAVGIFAAVILLRNQPTSNNQIQSQGTQSQNLDPNATAVNPVGGTYSYLDGTGYEHIIAMDPYGNLIGYSNLPPGTSQPQSGQMASYVSSMSGQYLVSPYGYTTPPYATPPGQ